MRLGISVLLPSGARAQVCARAWAHQVGYRVLLHARLPARRFTRANSLPFALPPLPPPAIVPVRLPPTPTAPALADREAACVFAALPVAGSWWQHMQTLPCWL